MTKDIILSQFHHFLKEHLNNLNQPVSSSHSFSCVISEGSAYYIEVVLTLRTVTVYTKLINQFECSEDCGKITEVLNSINKYGDGFFRFTDEGYIELYNFYLVKSFSKCPDKFFLDGIKHIEQYYETIIKVISGKLKPMPIWFHWQSLQINGGN